MYIQAATTLIKHTLVDEKIIENRCSDNRVYVAFSISVAYYELHSTTLIAPSLFS